MERRFQAGADRGERLGELLVAERVAGLHDHLGIGEKRVAHHALAEQRGTRHRENPGGQDGAHNPAANRGPPRPLIALAHRSSCPF